MGPRRIAIAWFFLLACASKEKAKETSGAGDSTEEVLVEFDGVTPNGTWEAHELPGGFDYEVTLDTLVMHDRGGENQHVVRRGVGVDPSRAYAVEVFFTIALAEDTTPPNSFCLNLNVAGPDGDLAPPSTWALNVDLAAGPSGGVMKYMGFVGGAFHQLGERPIAWGVRGQEYRFRVTVNLDAEGRAAPGLVTATVFEGATVREHFDVDYSTFPYQPSGAPVRIGMSTHGTDWSLRQLSVEYLD